MGLHFSRHTNNLSKRGFCRKVCQTKVEFTNFVIEWWSVLAVPNPIGCVALIGKVISYDKLRAPNLVTDTLLWLALKVTVMKNPSFWCAFGGTWHTQSAIEAWKKWWPSAVRSLTIPTFTGGFKSLRRYWNQFSVKITKKLSVIVGARTRRILM